MKGGSFYSWQWWVTGDEYGTYWASGYEGQMICVVPALDALVLRFGHTPEDRYPALGEWRERVLARARRGLRALVGEAEVKGTEERGNVRPSFAHIAAACRRDRRPRGSSRLSAPASWATWAASSRLVPRVTVSSVMATRSPACSTPAIVRRRRGPSLLCAR
jgi:hypothetical protein